MSSSHREEALAAWWRELSAPAARGMRALQFEYTSRGDRVAGRLWLPDATAEPHPLVWLQRAEADAGEADSVGELSRAWVKAGAAVAAIDLPLHGARASAKLSERFRQGLFHSGCGFPEWSQLWQEFVCQSVSDLSRGCDILSAHGAVDVRRSVYVGWELGGMVGAALCAISPRPFLFVHVLGGEGIPRSKTEALFEAVAEPKALIELEGQSGGGSSTAWRKIESFVKEHLGLKDFR